MPDLQHPATTAPEQRERATRVVIVGAGLLGGSLLAALQARRTHCSGALHLAAVTSTATRDALLALGWCDAVYEHAAIAEACAGADLILLCTPLLTIQTQLDAIAAHRHRLAPDAIVSDVGSTKGAICAHGFTAFPDDAPQAPRFVGGHPMAGSERSGLAAADPLLYQSALWVLCPPTGLDPARLATLRTLVHDVGARTAIIDPVTHDAAVARISHIPQIVSSMLAGWAGQDDRLATTALTLAAGGFRDMTRLALSSFEVWRDVVATNHAPIADGLHEIATLLSSLATSLRAKPDGARHDDTLAQTFALGHAFRQRFHMPRKGIQHDLSEFVVRLDDRPSQLLALLTPLAAADINVQDLEILKVREGECGTVLMGFSTPRDAKRAHDILIAAGFQLFER